MVRTNHSGNYCQQYCFELTTNARIRRRITFSLSFCLSGDNTVLPTKTAEQTQPPVRILLWFPFPIMAAGIISDCFVTSRKHELHSGDNIKDQSLYTRGFTTFPTYLQLSSNQCILILQPPGNPAISPYNEM